MPTGWWVHCARTGTGRWCWGCCWRGCAGVRGWGFGSGACRALTGGWRGGGGRGAITRSWRRGTRCLSGRGAYFHPKGPPGGGADRGLVGWRGPGRGLPLSAEGLDEILDGARRRAGLEHATCHQLRHTCLTRLREAGMALEAVQAQAGHASIESTRVYLHLANDWLADQYLRAA